MLDTRPYFRPLTIDFVALLRSLSPADWDLPTAARAWQVRDVVAHLTDTAFRRVSFHRDGHVPPPPPEGEPFVAFINRLNAEWVLAMRRASPQVLVDLFALASTQLADWIEQLMAARALGVFRMLFEALPVVAERARRSEVGIQILRHRRGFGAEQTLTDRAAALDR